MLITSFRFRTAWHIIRILTTKLHTYNFLTFGFNFRLQELTPANIKKMFQSAFFLIFNRSTH